jgi:deoxyadenosine/deoxycytidine kinase
MKRIVYSIEGNIGSGKTTLLHLFKIKNPQIFISPEPLHDWQKVASFNLLQTYYDQPNRWAYTFQNYALLTRMRQLNSLLSQNHG